MFAVDLDTGFREGAFDAAVIATLNQSFAAEMRFIDEGKQPDGIQNINRLVNIDAVVSHSIKDFSISAKAGITTSYFSHNGSGDGYHNDTGFTGGNVGIGAQYNINAHWSAQAQVIGSNYQQSDHSAYESFIYGSVGIKYTFGGW